VLGRESHKMDVICPECSTKNEVLWFPKNFMVIRMKGTTGGSGNYVHSDKKEKVVGACKKCSYKFTGDDL